jgi:hypothetical protein
LSHRPLWPLASLPFFPIVSCIVCSSCLPSLHWYCVSRPYFLFCCIHWSQANFWLVAERSLPHEGALVPIYWREICYRQPFLKEVINCAFLNSPLISTSWNLFSGKLDWRRTRALARLCIRHPLSGRGGLGTQGQLLGKCELWICHFSVSSALSSVNEC